MSNPRAILCGDVQPPRITRKSKPIHLRLWGRSRNVTLEISDISRRMVANVPELFIDLLEIATYVYCADQAVRRGGQKFRKLGAEWRRSLRFHVPVRKPEVWSSVEVGEGLENTLGFLSEDTYRFEFSELSNPPSIDQYIKFSENAGAAFQAKEVALFSGGLDSLSGAVQQAVVEGQSVALVSHRSTPKIDRRQLDLVRQLSDRCPGPKPLHVPVWIHLRGERAKENTQTTRSFLFAALAATVARMFRLSRILFYENGVTSLNLPISEQVIGTRATRTTHPQVLNGFAELFSALTGESFEVENQFLWKTKAEVVNLIGDAGCADLIKHSVSCVHTRERTRLHTHCGRCYQCIDRRFATLASKYAAHDPKEMYETDLLTDAHKPGDDRTMLESYIKTATEISKLRSEDEFFSRFGEASRLLRHVKGMVADEAAAGITKLYHRHASAVVGTLDDAIKAHASAIRGEELPDSCAIVLCLPKSYREVKVDVLSIRGPTFRKVGRQWLVGLEGEGELFEDLLGMRYIGHLLAHPGQELPVTVLEREVRGAPTDRQADEVYSDLSAAELAGENLSVVFEAADTGPALDPEAKKAYRERLDELEEELEQAKRNHDIGRHEKLEEEKNSLLAELLAAVGSRGQNRKTGSEADRRRLRVSYVIRTAIRVIKNDIPQLGAYFDSTIKTGYSCSYNPQPSHPIHWSL